MIYRKAKFIDIEEIYELVNHYAEEGLMLARSRNALYESLRDMIVAIDEKDGIVGVGGLEPPVLSRKGFTVPAATNYRLHSRTFM